MKLKNIGNKIISVGATVILPGETRARIRCALDMLKAKVKPCGRKHGNIPM